MGSVYACSAGMLLEPVGHLWAAFSPASGETALLNDESAAILEVLQAAGPADTAAVCEALAADSGLDAQALAEAVEASWPRLLEVGLVRERRAGHAAPQ